MQFKGDSSSSASHYKTWSNGTITREGKDVCFVVEPTSVLDSVRSPSTTTLSSSHGGGPLGGGGAAVSGGDGGKYGFEDLLDSSPGQEESILNLFMSGNDDLLDPDSCGFMDLSDPFFDQPNPFYGYKFPFLEAEEEKRQSLTNPESINPNPDSHSFGSDPPPSKRLNSGQPGSLQIPTNPNPGHFSVLSDPALPPPSKRLNSGQPGSLFAPTNPNPGHFSVRSERFNPGQPGSQWISPNPGHFSVVQDPPLPPRSKRCNPGRPGSGPGQDPFITEQLFNAAAEVTRTGDNSNLVLAQSILARLNHNLSQNKNRKSPFQRAALYVTQALQALLQGSCSPSHPQTLILRIAAYKAFSETSPFVPFVNFTANQMILECVEGFDQVHIVDFDIGLGSQWSSLIQELGSSKKRSSVSLKITAFVSSSSVFDQFEARFTEESLRSYAGEVGVTFEIEFLNVETRMNPSSWLDLESEAVAVNLPTSSVVSGYWPLILRFLKQISPDVVVCSDRSCDRNNDASFPNGVINALQYYTSLVESLESANGMINQEVGLSIERFYVQPSVEKLLKNRWMERSPPWRSLFGQCGFCPVNLSQITETQAECLMQRNAMRGFHIEKRQSSLVLCWQRKELVAVSAWKCSSRGS